MAGLRVRGGKWVFPVLMALAASLCCLLGFPNQAAAQAATGIAGIFNATTTTRAGMVREPSIDAAGDRLAYWSTGNPVGTNSDGNIETFLAGNHTGSAGFPLQLTNSTGNILGGWNLAPSVDYAGDYVAFFSDRNLNSAGVQVADGGSGGSNPGSYFQIFRANIDATGRFTVTQVTQTTGGANIDPSISGGGSEIAFISDRNLTGSNSNFNQQIFLAGPLTGQSGTWPFTQVTNSSGGVNETPALSGDGTRLAFVSNQPLLGNTYPDYVSGAFRIFVYGVAQKEMVQITPATTGQSGDDLQPSIDNTGQHIAFASTRDFTGNNPGHDQQIFLATIPSSINYTVSGGGVTFQQITTATLASVANMEPAIDGDGTRIAYVSGPLGAQHIQLYDTVVKRTLPLTATADSNSNPVIGADGTSLAWSGNGAVLTSTFPLVDLSVAGAISPSLPTAGSPLTYTVQVKNTGPSPAVGAIFTDTIPLQMQGAQWICTATSGSSCSSSGSTLGSGQTLTQPVNLAANSGSLTFVISGILAANARSPLTNTFGIQAPSTVIEHDLSHNTGETVSEPPFILGDLSISSSASPKSVVAGTSLTYTLVYANAGPSDAWGTTITDTLPVSATFSRMLSGGQSPITKTIGSMTTISWYDSVVSPSVSSSLSFLVNVSAAAEGSTLSNSANIEAASTRDLNQSNNTSTLSTSVTGSADLAIGLSARPASAVPGMPLTYTIYYTNSGPSWTRDLYVTDTLPSGTGWAGVTGSSPAPTSAPASGGTGNVVWHLGRLSTASGSHSSSISFAVSILPTALGSITDTAQVASHTPDPVKSNNQASLVKQLLPQANLKLTARAQASIVAGTPLTYTIYYTNSGPSWARVVSVTDTLPVSVTFGKMLSGQTPITTTSGSKSMLTWSASSSGNLGVSSSAYITAPMSGALSFVANVNAAAEGEVLTDTATIHSASTPDPVQANNTFTTTTKVTGSADAKISLRPALARVVAGTPLTYTIYYTNSGPSWTRDLYITDSLPSGESWKGILAGSRAPSITSTPATGGGSVVWSLGHLSSSASGPNYGSISFDVTVLPGTQGTVTQTAQIASHTPDPVLSNNQSPVSTPVDTRAHLQMGIGGPASAPAGGVITYTLLYTNTGPSTAQNVAVTDTLPLSVTWKVATPNPKGGAPSGRLVVWSLGAMSPGDGAITITVQSSSAATGQLVDSAVISSTTADPAPGHNSATITTTLTYLADLQLTKRPISPTPVAGLTYTYTLSYGNGGPSDAHNVSITDTLPLNATWGGQLAASPGTNPQLATSGQAVTWTLGTLPAASSGLTITYYVNVKPAASGRLQNSAAITSTTTDPDLANNRSTPSAAVTAQADLQLVKTAASPTPVAGSDRKSTRLNSSHRV